MRGRWVHSVIAFWGEEVKIRTKRADGDLGFINHRIRRKGEVLDFSICTSYTLIDHRFWIRGLVTMSVSLGSNAPD